MKRRLGESRKDGTPVLSAAVPLPPGAAGRRLGTGALAGVAALCLALSACDQKKEDSNGADRTQWATADGDCRRVKLVDDATHQALRGAEDLVYDRQADRILISVYDRWALADAVAENRDELPQGGIYALTVSRLDVARDRLPVANLTAKYAGSADFHPHGFDVRPVSPSLAQMAVVDRHYRRVGHGKRARWSLQVKLDVFSLQGDQVRYAGSIATPELCRANDVAIGGPGRFYVSVDRAGCDGAGRVAELALNKGSGRIYDVSFPRQSGEPARVREFAKGLKFPNGLTVSQDGRSLWVATTRDRELHLFPLDRAGPTGTKQRQALTVSLPAAPDNISASPSGHVMIAAHPNLLQLTLYRYRLFGARHSGSMVLSFDPEKRHMSTVLKDSGGKFYSAATTAVSVGDKIVMGSVGDDGLAVCRLRGVR